MKRCLITYEPIQGDITYSDKGLRQLSHRLHHIEPLEWSSQELRQEAMRRTTKMSIQGVQPKLSARLNIQKGKFDLTDQGGTYILKPSSDLWPELPTNEAITMTLAKTIGLDIPLHGLVYTRSGELVYFIKRFDRYQKNQKYALEDFAQLSGKNRETKYNSSMEHVAKIIDTYTTFPAKEKIKLFKMILFSYLTGNEDMHLKNFSLISRNDIIELSPCYDLLNTTIALSFPEEELALPLKGKKNRLKKSDFMDYFTSTLMLGERTAQFILKDIYSQQPIWIDMIKTSFLSPLMQEKYIKLLSQRFSVMFQP